MTEVKINDYDVKIKDYDEKIKEMKKKVRNKGLVLLLFLSFEVFFFFGAMYIYNSANATIKAAKPIIYIYPTEEIELSVKLGKPENLLVSYPNYKEIWNVKAEPNGTLTEIGTNKKLYSLYYENRINRKIKIENEGFVVEGEKTAEFLDEKLEILGLNYKEREEFIIYWLPKLEVNKYNYIRFMSDEEIEDNMPLEFSVQPDTLIRVNMIFKGLDKPIKVEKQELEKKERKGFTVVEWGATEIK